jgi:hypothetical protein
VIVEIARHLIPIVEMEHVNTIIMRTVCYVQKIVGRVLHPLNLFAETVHVMEVKHVVIAQLIVQVYVNVIKEKFVMILMCA